MISDVLYGEGLAAGRRDCERTHDELAGSCFDSGWEDGYEDGQARGRVQGAAIVAGLIALAWMWRARS